MSEIKIKCQDDSEFKCIRRIACKLGLAIPESDDEVLNLSQFRRIERAINSEFEQLTSLANENERLRSERDELCEVLECICSYLSEDGLMTTGLAKEIVNAQSLLMKLTVSNSNGD